MESIAGIITIVQEGRFQLLDEHGVSHHFILHHRAAADPEQLPCLLSCPVRVSYVDSGELIGHAAIRLQLQQPRKN